MSVKQAYNLGAAHAHAIFVKRAQGENLGDPNFWQGGTPDPNAAPPPPANAEEALSGLPAGSFQGMQTKITPDGQKSTSLKVSPDVLASPEGLAAMFQTGEDVKVEIANPQATEAAAPMPGTGSDAGIPPEGMGELPPEAAGKMAALQRLGLLKTAALSTPSSQKTRSSLSRLPLPVAIPVLASLMGAQAYIHHKRHEPKGIQKVTRPINKLLGFEA